MCVYIYECVCVCAYAFRENKEREREREGKVTYLNLLSSLKKANESYRIVGIERRLLLPCAFGRIELTSRSNVSMHARSNARGFVVTDVCEKCALEFRMQVSPPWQLQQQHQAIASENPDSILRRHLMKMKLILLHKGTYT